MTNKDGITQLYTLLYSCYEDRQKVIDLATESGLPLDNVAPGGTLSECIESIVREAERLGSVDVMNDKIVQELRDQNGNSDQIGGDQIDIGNIESSVVAAGKYARAIVNKYIYYFGPSYWLVIIAFSVPFVIALAWFLWPFVSKMGGDINFAVVDFAEIDTSGAVVKSDVGSDISKRLYDELRKISDRNCPDNFLRGTLCSIFQTNKTTLIWHRSLDSLKYFQKQKLGRLKNNDTEGQCDEASQLAEDINSDVVVYGVLDRRSNKDNKFSLRFYIQDSELQDLFDRENIFSKVDETICYSMAAPIPFATNQSGENARDRNIEFQSYIFFKLVLGASQYNNSYWEAAIEQFNKVDFSLEEHEREKYAIDKVAYLLGDAYLRVYNSQANDNAFNDIPDWVCKTNGGPQSEHMEILAGERDLTLLDKAENAFNIIVDTPGADQYQAEAGLGNVWFQIGQLAQQQYHGNESNRTIQSTKQSTAKNFLLNMECSLENITHIFEYAREFYEKSINIANEYEKSMSESHYKYFTSTVIHQTNLTYYPEIKNLSDRCYQARDIKICNEAISRLNQLIHDSTESELLNELAKDNKRLAEAYLIIGDAYYSLSQIDEENDSMEYLSQAREYIKDCEVLEDSGFDNEIERIKNMCQTILE